MIKSKEYYEKQLEDILKRRELSTHLSSYQELKTIEYLKNKIKYLEDIG